MTDLKKVVVVAAPLLAFCLFVLPQIARADTYNITVDACTGGCGSSPFATVDVTQAGANNVTVVVTFTNPASRFIKTGSGDEVNFAFNVAGDPTLALVGSVLSGGSPNAALSLDNGGVSGSAMTNANFGTFHYAIVCPGCGNGNAGGYFGPLQFTVSAAGLLAADFATLSTGGAAMGNQFFAVDMFSGDTQNTGIVAGSTTGTPRITATPEPLSMLTLGLATLGLGLIRRKKQ